MTICPMLNILSVTFPFFALVFTGYVAARRGWLTLAAIPGLNTFVCCVHDGFVHVPDANGRSQLE